jgi:nucleoside-diphosphate-sugar epimerase
MAAKILVTGPFGQIGTELVPALQARYGVQNVVALGHSKVPEGFEGVVERADVTDVGKLREVMEKHQITQVYHLAALLSVTGEQHPHKAWDINLVALKGLFDLCVELKVQKVFWASSMAVFGPTTPKLQTPQHTSIEPTTMYGVTKYAGELLGQYYFHKFGLDVRSLRYPGIISWKELPGGGTTDYAVGIFYGALTEGTYECFVKEETTLPMIYMEDAIKATLQIMEAESSQIKVRTSYNLAAISFNVAELANEIRKHTPLEVVYKPDHRQNIADSWPDSIDDSEARKDWGWSPKFGLQELVDVMITNLKPKLAQ